MKASINLIRLTFLLLWLVVMVAHYAGIVSEDMYSAFVVYVVCLLIATIVFEFLPHPRPKPPKEEYGPGKWLSDLGAYDWEVDDKKKKV